MAEHIIEFKNVTKRYPGQEALKDTSFKLPRGKIIGLIGPNGSGKSTTLKLTAGLVRPNSGTVSVNGKPVIRRNAAETAYLSELDAFYNFFTVEETILFYESIYRDFDIKKAFELLSFMQLEKGKKVKHLSKGNRGRLKIVLTLSRRVPLILMDEPLSGLDPMARELIIKGLISYIDLDSQTIVMATHEVAEIEPLLDIVAAVKDGRVIKIEAVENIRNENHQSLVEWMKELY